MTAASAAPQCHSERPHGAKNPSPVTCIPPPVSSLQSPVTRIVVSYNGLPHIAACLQSLLADGPPEDVVVVDNASTDGTVELLRRELPGVRLLALPENAGYGAAVNAAARDVESPYLLVLNQDVVLEAGCAARLVDALEQQPDAALATPKILLKADPGRINACGNAPHLTGLTPCRGFGRPSADFTVREDILAVSGAVFAVRRSAFEALGGFDGSFFLYYEDTDLSLRAALAGWRCLLVPEALAYHDFEPRFSPAKLYWLERNRPAALLKLYRWRTLAGLLPALLLAELAVWARCLLWGPAHLRAKARALRSLIAALPAILVARRTTQALRAVPDRAILARCSAALTLDEVAPGAAGLPTALADLPFRLWRRLLLKAITW